MEFSCFDRNTMSYVGACRLPEGQIDPPGTGHVFGDVCYTLIETDVEARIMYFKMDAIQPYLTEE